MADIRFHLSADDAHSFGTIRIANTSISGKVGDLAWTYYPSIAEKAGDIWVRAQGQAEQDPWLPGSYANFVMLHESGHALGLKHPFDDEITLPTVHDNQSLTVMSYYAQSGISGSKFSFFPTTPMVLDIAAIQAAYGPNANFNTGDTIYRYSDSATYHHTIWDAGGEDTLSYDGNQDAVIRLEAVHSSRIGNPVFIEASLDADRNEVDNVWIAHKTEIENIVSGSGNDLLSGNSANNAIDGGSGIDTYIVTGGRERYVIQTDGTASVLSDLTGVDGTDSLLNVERLKFSDMQLALDVSKSGAAGMAAQIIGTIAYPLIGSPAVAGEVIALLDKGDSTSSIFQKLLDSGTISALAGSGGNIDLVRLVGRNVLGTEIEDEFANALASNLKGNGGEFSQTDFLVAVSTHSLNLAHIELLGLANSGLQYF